MSLESLLLGSTRKQQVHDVNNEFLNNHSSAAGWMVDCVCVTYASHIVVVLHHSTRFQLDLYIGSDMMYEIMKRTPEHTFFPTNRIFNLPHHIGMV